MLPNLGAWDMGTGRYLDDPIATNGTSWIWRDYSGSAKWLTLVLLMVLTQLLLITQLMLSLEVVTGLQVPLNLGLIPILTQ
jgi:hypothetical protein